VLIPGAIPGVSIKVVKVVKVLKKPAQDLKVAKPDINLSNFSDPRGFTGVSDSFTLISPLFSPLFLIKTPVPSRLIPSFLSKS